MATDLLATLRERLSRGRYACFVRLQRGENVLDAEIAEGSVGTQLAGLIVVALGLKEATGIPWLDEAESAIIPADVANLLSIAVIEEVRDREPDEPIPSAAYVGLAQRIAEFLSRGECGVGCIADWTITPK